MRIAEERPAAAEQRANASAAAAADAAAKAQHLEVELEHAKSEIARWSTKYESRISQASSVQHGLEGRLREREAELDKVKER